MQFFEKPIINLHSLLHTATESQQAEIATNSPAILCTLTPVFAIPQVQGHLNELCNSDVTQSSV